MTRPHTAEQLTRTNAIELAGYPPRIRTALEQIERATYPYRTATGPGPTNGISDPTGTASIEPGWQVEQAREVKRRLNTIVLELDLHVRQLAAILAVWAPTHHKPIWCANHARYGRNEPRADDGSRDCAWCCNTLRNFGTKPNAELIRLHTEGRRLTEADYIRILTTRISA